MKTQIPFSHLLSGHIVIQLLINDRFAVFIIDTGASYSVVNTNRVEHFDMITEYSPEMAVGAGAADIPMSMTRNNTAVIGDLKIPYWELAVMDLAHVNRAFAELDIPEVDGVLGADILVRYGAVIDYRNDVLELNYS